jgi:glycosyltransferase involved in cell wall biosynthesis
MIYINGKSFAQPLTGVQRYAIQILPALDQLLDEERSRISDHIVLLVPERARLAVPSYRHIQVRSLPGDDNLHAWEQYRLPLAARGHLLINLAGSAPLLKLGQVCTFHDTAVFDFSDAYSPAFNRWYRFLFTVQAKLSRRLLTVSSFSRERIVHHLGVPPSKVGIVHSGADHMRALVQDPGVLTKLKVESGRYLLAVGSANPTKNFARLIDAFAMLKNTDARLVVVGGSNAAIFAQSAVAAREDPRIIRAGRLTDEELRSLYTHARAYVFPSVYEGFGLPPLEAMICGCPVIAARAASIPEICGPAAAYFDPLSLEDMHNAMARAWTDDAWLQLIRQEGRRRGELFTWRNAATSLLDELARVGVATPSQPR